MRATNGMPPAQRAESARQRLALLQAGTRPEDLHAAEARYQAGRGRSGLSRKGFRKEDIDSRARPSGRRRKASVAELDARLSEAELTRPGRCHRRSGQRAPGRSGSRRADRRHDAGILAALGQGLRSRNRPGPRSSRPARHRPRRWLWQSRLQRPRRPDRLRRLSFCPAMCRRSTTASIRSSASKIYVDNPSGILKSGMSATVRLQ